MEQMYRIVREFARRQAEAEREALREYRRGDEEQAHYRDGKAEAYSEIVAELNRLVAEMNAGEGS